MSTDDGSDLAALQRRAYGPGGSEPLSAAEHERLALLERRQHDRTPLPDDARDADGPRSADNEHAPVDAAVAELMPPAPHRRPRGWVTAAVAVLIAGTVGFGAGQFLTAAGSGSTADELPEFAFAQSDEDIIPGSDVIEGSDIRAETTRFIARFRGDDIYLARQNSGGTCIVALRFGDPAQAMSGCVSGAGANGGGGMGFGGSVEIAFGDFVPMQAGEAVRLSQSVTAYTH